MARQKISSHLCSFAASVNLAVSYLGFYSFGFFITTLLLSPGISHAEEPAKGPDSLCGISEGAPKSSVKGRTSPDGVVFSDCTLGVLKGTGAVSFCGNLVYTITWNRVYCDEPTTGTPGLAAVNEDYNTLLDALLASGWQQFAVTEKASNELVPKMWFSRGGHQRILTITRDYGGFWPVVRLSLSTTADDLCSAGL